MNKYIIWICDDEGNRIYGKKVKAKSFEDAENKAYKWSMEVESEEGWFTTYEVELAE